MITEEEAKRAVNTIIEYCLSTKHCDENDASMYNDGEPVCAIKGFCRNCGKLDFCFMNPYAFVTAKKHDPVSHPSHYCAGGIETIDIVKAKMPPERFRGFLQGNVIKYVTRAEFKGKQLEDLKKASWYLDRLITELEKDKET